MILIIVRLGHRTVIMNCKVSESVLPGLAAICPLFLTMHQ